MSVRDIIQAAAGVGGDKLYVDDVFSTYLYTGNGSTQTITNGIDLAGEGGMVWIKSRSQGRPHKILDTNRGPWLFLGSNSTAAQAYEYQGLNAFNSNGFGLSTDPNYNFTSELYASWTFRKAPKFFDVVTYTGDGTNNRQIPHSLDSVPGMMIFKRTDATEAWFVYHRGVTTPNSDWWTNFARLNTTDAFISDSAPPNQPTSTYISVNSNFLNASGKSYVVYLFAHDAGGFGDDGNQNIVACGSFTTDGSYNSSTTLGWEPQWVLVKSSSASGGWFLFDNMRGMPVSGNDSWLRAESIGAESTSSVACRPNATGFTTFNLSANTTHIYMAIRRPNKPPTSGTEVFSPNTSASQSVGTNITTGFPVDAQIQVIRTVYEDNRLFTDRLRGFNSTTNQSLTFPFLTTNTTNAEGNAAATLNMGNTGYQVPPVFGNLNTVFWNFRRAPGFFDVVCYTGTGVATTVNHNLGVAPELMIVKSRNTTVAWYAFCDFTETNFKRLVFSSNVNSITYLYTAGAGIGVKPTSSTFLASGNASDTSATTYVAYLFATLPGISKVGSYTGTGTTQQINCGFTTGARLVIIKRTDSTGDWYVWDSARGIVSGNDPYLLLNSTAAEVTNTDYVDTFASGFEISSTAPAAINASGGSFIFLAIA